MKKKMIRLGLAGAAAAAMVVMSSCGSSADSASTESTEETVEETLAETESYADESSVVLCDYSSIPVTITKQTVTDEDVEDQIQQTLDANPNYVEVDRAVQDGDRVNIDYEGKIDGQTFDGGSAEGYDLDIGSGTFIDGFEDGVIGMSKGETKDLNLKFPDDYSNSDVAGKDVVFTVTVNSVKEKQDSVLDTDFLSRIGSEATTVDEYRQSVRDSLEQEAASQEESDTQQEVLSYMIKNSQITLGKTDVDKQYNLGLINITNMANTYGIDLDTYAAYYGTTLDGLHSLIRQNAENTVKSQLVLNKVAEEQGLTAEDSDLESFAQEQGYDSKDAMIDSAGVTEDMIRSDVLYEKAMDYLVSKAQITYEEETEEDTEAADTEAAETEAADTEAESAADTTADTAAADTEGIAAESSS